MIANKLNKAHTIKAYSKSATLISSHYVFYSSDHSLTILLFTVFSLKLVNTKVIINITTASIE